MKNAIVLILFGLLLRYGSADVSHLAKSHHSQYLPPASQNLPIEQDYNGIDSHANHGYLPPANGNQNENHGYLPPYQDQGHQQHNHHDHHDHHDSSQNHQHGQQHQNGQQHQQDYHHDNHHNHQQYDPSVQVSYHNDYAVNRQHDQPHSGHVHTDHSHEQHNNQDQYDNSHHEHVNIDQQQLEPVVPSSLSVQSYLPPTAGSHVDGHVNPSQMRRHQNSVYNSPRPFTAAHSISQQVSPSPQNGYDYPPPAIQPTESLYPNQVEHRNPVVADGHQHTHQGSPQTNHVGPINSNHGHNEVSNQGYLPPSQSSHGNPEILSHNSGHSYQEPHQDYLPPTQLNHGIPASSQQEYLPPTQSTHQGYLPPNQGHHASHLNHAVPRDLPVQEYLPPTQPTHQGYLPPNQENHVSHFNHASPGGSQIHTESEQGQGYLPPSQEHHVPHSNQVHSHQAPQQDYLPPSPSNQVHSHQAPQQDYLPPSHSSHLNSRNLPFLDGHVHQESTNIPPSQSHHATSANLPFLDDHLGHVHQESKHGPSNHATSASLPFLDDLRGHVHQDPQQNYFNPTQSSHAHNSQQDYLPPTPSIPGGHTNNGITDAHSHSVQNLQQNAVDLPNSSDALHVVPPPQLGPVHHNQEPEARSKLTVRGHVNVPLPIPQAGYFFVPGSVSRIPSLNTGKSEGLRPAINIPAIIGPQPTQAYQQPIALAPTQRISSPEYTRKFLLPNSNRPADKRSSEFSIIPSIQTQHDQQSFVAQRNPQNHGQNVFRDLPFLPQSNVQSLPHQNLNQDHGAYHREDRQFSPPENLSNRGLSLQSIARSQVAYQQSQISQPQGQSNFRGEAYLPPANDQHSHQHDHSYNQPQPLIQQQNHHHHSTNDDRGYLPPESQNQMTSLQSYMNNVDPSDRYGSSQYHSPPPIQKGAPSPPFVTSPPMYSMPSAVVSYAPGSAYKVSTNTPFNTLAPATYLPAVESAVPQQDHQHDHSAVNLQLNEAAKRNLAKIMPKDNTVFPLEELLDIQNGDIDLPQLMDELRGRVRTVQIINNHANSVKNIKVLETADQHGVKTIKILGPSNEDPMGEHKVVHIVGKGSHPEGIRQTIKIFADHKDVSLPTQNAYLPPSKAKTSYVRVSRHSQEGFRRH